MNKITVILGKGASGKTTLAHSLSNGKEIIEESCRSTFDLRNYYPEDENSNSVIIDEGITTIKNILLYFDNPIIYRRKPYTESGRIYSYRPNIIMTSNTLTIEDLKKLPKQCFDSLVVIDAESTNIDWRGIYPKFDPLKINWRMYLQMTGRGSRVKGMSEETAERTAKTWGDYRKRITLFDLLTESKELSEETAKRLKDLWTEFQNDTEKEIERQEKEKEKDAKPKLSVGVLYTDISTLNTFMANIHDNNTYIPIKNCGVVIGHAFDSIVILPQNGNAYNQDWLEMVIATRLNK